MTLVNTETGEVIAYADVRTSVDNAKASLEEAANEIVWQIENHVWTALGYADWNEMREAEYGGAAFLVPRADRSELVTRMRKAGLTQQDIASTAGVSVGTVNGDLKFSSENEAAATEPIINSRGQSRPAAYARPSSPVAESEPTAEEAVESTPRIDLEEFIKADRNVQLTSWRRSFMTHIKRAIEITLFTPEDVAEKADVELIDELERLSKDLANYVARVKAKRPTRLTAIRGGAK